MKVSQAIEQRRSIKHFDPNHEMTSDEVQQLLKLTLLSPTSFNIQNWRFILVQDKAKKQALRPLCFNQAQIEESSLVVILAADLKAALREPARYWKDAPEEVQKMLVPMIAGFYEGKDQLQRDEAMRSTGIAAQTLMLTAKSMGYDTCPMVGFDFDKVAQFVGLPEDHVLSMIITVGKATQQAYARGGQLTYEEVVLTEKF